LLSVYKKADLTLAICTLESTKVKNSNALTGVGLGLMGILGD
jgi:hypothetical protein